MKITKMVPRNQSQSVMSTILITKNPKLMQLDRRKRNESNRKVSLTKSQPKKLTCSIIHLIGPKLMQQLKRKCDHG